MIKLDNSTTIPNVFPNKQKSCNVNGQDVRGWYALDYTFEDLYKHVSLTQIIFSTTHLFDGLLPITGVQDATGDERPPFWLNVQYPTSYTQQKHDPVLFLQTLNDRLNKAKTKLVFWFLEKDTFEPTTKQTYGSILGNLSTVKSFASGILVPKEHIWPVSTDLFLELSTTLVSDAHKLGLQAYASGFANDNIVSYNYSFDPAAEYLQFIDNSQFPVDGVFTDFPSTASASVGERMASEVFLVHLVSK